MRKKEIFGLAVLISVCQLASSGCLSSKMAEGIADVMVAKIIEPPLELTTSTVAFQQKKGRWPNDYAELRSFAAANSGASLTNYDRVDFTPNPDGSVGILAIAPGMTNQMTLRVTNQVASGLPEKSRN